MKNRIITIVAALAAFSAMFLTGCTTADGRQSMLGNGLIGGGLGAGIGGLAGGGKGAAIGGASGLGLGVIGSAIANAVNKPHEIETQAITLVDQRNEPVTLETTEKNGDKFVANAKPWSDFRTAEPNKRWVLVELTKNGKRDRYYLRNVATGEVVKNVPSEIKEVHNERALASAKTSAEPVPVPTTVAVPVATVSNATPTPVPTTTPVPVAGK